MQRVWFSNHWPWNVVPIVIKANHRFQHIVNLITECYYQGWLKAVFNLSLSQRGFFTAAHHVLCSWCTNKFVLCVNPFDFHVLFVSANGWCRWSFILKSVFVIVEAKIHETDDKLYECISTITLKEIFCNQATNLNWTYRNNAAWRLEAQTSDNEMTSFHVMNHWWLSARCLVAMFQPFKSL